LKEKDFDKYLQLLENLKIKKINVRRKKIEGLIKRV
jgi:hypothetical protein